MTKNIVIQRGIAFSIKCPYCDAQPGKPCTFLTGAPVRHVCKFCKSMGAFGLHFLRASTASEKHALWQLACQAEDAYVDDWLASYEGDPHQPWCPDR